MTSFEYLCFREGMQPAWTVAFNPEWDGMSADDDAFGADDWSHAADDASDIGGGFDEYDYWEIEESREEQEREFQAFLDLLGDA